MSKKRCHPERSLSAHARESKKPSPDPILAGSLFP
jgi:hypothetical protein